MAAANRGIKIDGPNNEIVAHDPSGTRTFVVDGDTGQVTITGTTPDGSTVLIGDQGFQTFTEDGSLATQLGTFGEDYLGISNGTETVAAITAAGQFIGQNLSISGDPTILGTPLLGDFANFTPVSVNSPVGIMDRLGWTLVGNAERNIQGASFTTEERELFEFEFEQISGRAYRYTVEPFSAYVGADAYGELIARYEYDGARPTLDSPIFRRITVRPLGSTDMAVFGGAFIHQPAIGTGTRTMRLLLSIKSTGGTTTVYNSADGGYLRAYIEDIGMKVENTAVTRDYSRQVGNTTTAPTPTAPTKKNYTRTFEAQSVQTYINNGQKFVGAKADERMFQGNSGYNTQNGVSTGNLRSLATYASWTGELSGAELTGVEVYIYFHHWYYNSGGTAEIGLHGYDTIPATFSGNSNNALNTHFDKPEGRWVSIPSQYWAGFKSGQWKGFWLGPGNYRSNYGYGGVGPLFRFRYKK